jgi:transcriptional antiterminator RfaH
MDRGEGRFSRPDAHGRALMDGASPYWAVARTEPKREAAAVHFLRLAGYSTYLPRIAERRSRGGRRIVTAVPLFPSYLFVHIQSGWWAARWSVGVAGLVTTGGSMPAKVPDHVLEELRGREGKDGCVLLPEAPRLKAGDRIRITGGLLAGAGGLYAGQRSGERVVVLLSLLGAQRLAVLPESAIAPA